MSFNRNCIAICRKEITIRDYAGVKHGPIVIEEGYWIAANVTILRNMHIGEGCVIGVGAIVQGDIPPHSLVTGDRKMNIVPIRKR